ncbi:MAG: histidinol dehydrogenase [Treponema sp.]|nr:histidinol dehydrogenase [Spirochaetia bacterium]MDY2840485.1 histidinol dehydrogenase [Treponema sp.]MDY5124456.1 histidinol dehydrogenase [Treponema sp.]
MIKIQNYKNVEDDFFKGRSFGDSNDVVKSVLEEVQKKGDAALRIYGQKFDVSVPAEFEVPQEELKAAAEKLKIEKREVYDAIVYSHDLALKFAKKQRESFTDFEDELEPGIFTGQKTIPVDRAGCYVPAGRFPLVSTVIMTVTPAIAAGVKDVILCTPPRVHPADKVEAGKQGAGIPGKAYVGGKPYADEGIMAAAYICGVNHLYAVGGSQAIGAMAYGTPSIPKVDVIVGPGNKYVASAKKEVYGTVGIDMIAGPTEVLVIADDSANPSWVAADLLAQAEHDVVAQPILVTTSENLANKVAEEIEIQLDTLTTKETARKSVDDFGRIIIVESLEQAAEVANKKAPEHLELAMAIGSERDKVQNLVHNYGSLFIGHYSAEVFGDYSAGLNHTLPTSGSAKFTGGLSVRMFLKTVTTLRVDESKNGIFMSAAAAGYLGDAEGLAGHARAARIRIEKK